MWLDMQVELIAFISDMARRSALAEACETSGDYLWQVATRRRRASPELAEKIEAATTAIGPATVTKESIVFPPTSPADQAEAKRAAPQQEAA